MLPPDLDLERLQRLADRAIQHLKDEERQGYETSLDIAKEKTQYFEKLAIGSGAAFAAIVSFLGTQHSKLYPHPLLRAALVSLIVAIAAALYRNFRYPFYVTRVRNLNIYVAQREEQQRRNALFQKKPIHDFETGSELDLVKWTVEFEKSDLQVEALIRRTNQQQRKLWVECVGVELLCLAALASAIVTLGLLAWINF